MLDIILGIIVGAVFARLVESCVCRKTKRKRCKDCKNTEICRRHASGNPDSLAAYRIRTQHKKGNCYTYTRKKWKLWRPK